MRPDIGHLPGNQVRVPILAYHYTGVPDADDIHITVATEMFEQQMRHLADSGYRSIGLHQLRDAFSSSARSVVITFDDGRDCVFREAFRVLKRYGMTATVFLISSRLDRERFLSRKQIAEMASHGISFESHSVNHLRLSALSTADKTFELEHSRSVLEQQLQREIAYLAYPFGDYDAEVQTLARAAGYKAVVSSRTGVADASSDPFALPRVGIRRQDDMTRFVRKLHGQFDAAASQPASLAARLRAQASRMWGKHF